MNTAKVFYFSLLFLLFFLSLQNLLLSWVPLNLFALYIFEHKLVLWYIYIVRENLWVSIIKRDHFRQPTNTFMLVVRSFQKFTHIIEDQIIFEHRDNIGILVIYDVIHYLSVVILFGSQVLLLKIVPDDFSWIYKSGLYLIHSFYFGKIDHGVWVL